MDPEWLNCYDPMKMDHAGPLIAMALSAQPLEAVDNAAVTLGAVLPELLDIGLRLGVAAVMGGLIGWERGRAEKPADARTMMLIAVGAAAFVLVGARVVAESEAGGVVQADPNRVLSYVVSGVGFLGAGAILHSKKSVLGLTTAASVWCTAAVGAAAGLGEYAVGAMVTLIVLITLWFPWLTHRIANESGERTQNGA
jgi:uncharacterized membrane protein YhiD involved in acid resistance